MRISDDDVRQSMPPLLSLIQYIILHHITSAPVPKIIFSFGEEVRIVDPIRRLLDKQLPGVLLLLKVLPDECNYESCEALLCRNGLCLAFLQKPGDSVLTNHLDCALILAEHSCSCLGRGQVEDFLHVTQLCIL